MYSDGALPLPASAIDPAKKAVGLSLTRDGRVHVHFSLSATLSRGKAAFVLATLALFLLWGLRGMGEQSALRQRLHELEDGMSRRVSWLARHGLPRARLAAAEPVVHEDGRKHLLVPAEGISRLADALAPETALPPVDDSYLCGERAAVVTEAEVVRQKLALAAVSYKAPLSLRNSMESWRRGGLLDLADELMIFLNAPDEENLAIAKEFGFDVYTTAPWDRPLEGGNVMFGPALSYLVANSSADVILMLEKDFVLSADREMTQRELYAGMVAVTRGVDVYRLRGKTDFPAEGMPDCCAPTPEGQTPACPFHSNWRTAGGFGDSMNWLLIFCDPDIMEHANGRLAQCTSEPTAPDSYCFTSAESNWSNNPALFRRDWFTEKVQPVALEGEEAFAKNHFFEFNMIREWMQWRPPPKVCVSLQGIFTHLEIDQ